MVKHCQQLDQILDFLRSGSHPHACADGGNGQQAACIYRPACATKRLLAEKFELFTGLNRLHRPVEFYYYPNEDHSPDHPLARLSTLQRNLDWYRFWLQGHYEDPAQDDPGRYARWRDLLKLQKESDRSEGIAAPPSWRRAQAEDGLAATSKPGGFSGARKSISATVFKVMRTGQMTCPARGHMAEFPTRRLRTRRSCRRAGRQRSWPRLARALFRLLALNC